MEKQFFRSESCRCHARGRKDCVRQQKQPSRSNAAVGKYKMIHSLSKTRLAVSYRFKYVLNYMAQQFHFQVYITINENICPQRTCTRMFFTVLLIIAPNGATQSLSMGRMRNKSRCIYTMGHHSAEHQRTNCGSTTARTNLKIIMLRGGKKKSPKQKNVTPVVSNSKTGK